MKLLIDSHVWIWWMADLEALSKETRHILEDPRNEIFVSTASCWEIAIKYSIGKITLSSSPEEFFIHGLAKCGFSTLKIDNIHALRVTSLPLHHNDPFDRMLIAQAQVEKLPIITSDKKFSMYEVQLIQAR